MMKALVRRLQRTVDPNSDTAFLRLCELLKDTLEPREKNGHAAERPPLAQIIVNEKPVMPAPESEPDPPGPDYEEGGQAFTAVDVP